MTKDKHLSSHKAAEWGSLVHLRDVSKSIDDMTCFVRKSDLKEPVELCQRGVLIDVSRAEHSIMQMKTRDCMLEVNT